MIYELIERVIIGFIRWRYAREIRRVRIAAGAGLALTALGIAAYLAARNGGGEIDQ